MRTRSIQRGAIALAVLGALTLAVIASPVGAAKKPVTKKKAKAISTKTFNTLFPGSFSSALTAATVQDACANGTVLAYLYIQDGDLSATFSTNGVTNSFNCAGGPIEARTNGVGDYDVRVPGITSLPSLANDDSIVATLSVGNDTPEFAAYESSSGDDFIEVEVFDDAGANIDDEVAIAFYNNP